MGGGGGGGLGDDNRKFMACSLKFQSLGFEKFEKSKDLRHLTKNAAALGRLELIALKPAGGHAVKFEVLVSYPWKISRSYLPRYWGETVGTSGLLEVTG